MHLTLVEFQCEKKYLFTIDFPQDVGCGVGGPLREIVRLSGAHITGINNNGYQVERCKLFSKKLGMEDKTDFVKVNLLKIIFLI